MRIRGAVWLGFPSYPFAFGYRLVCSGRLPFGFTESRLMLQDVVWDVFLRVQIYVLPGVIPLAEGKVPVGLVQA